MKFGDDPYLLFKTRVDGLIVTNTTIKRPSSLKSENKNEGGGLSGEPLKNLSTKAVRDMYVLTEGKVNFSSKCFLAVASSFSIHFSDIGGFFFPLKWLWLIDDSRLRKMTI